MASVFRGKVVGTLKGFSGSHIDICRDGDDTFIRKYVKDCHKLEAESGWLSSMVDLCVEFKVPRFYRQWLGENSYYEMEYIRGWTLEEHLQRCPVDEIETWAVRCEKIIRLFSEGDPAYADSSYLRSVLDDTLSGQYLQLDRVCARLEDYAPPRTCCHGDLTLDNILVAPDGQWYLIDPLLNKFGSVYWDIAKLFQSCYCDWYQIRTATTDVSYVAGRSRRLRMFARALLGRLGHPPMHQTLQEYCLFTAVVLLRIVKHAKSQGQRDMLRKRACVMLDQYLGVRAPFNMEDAEWI